MKYLSILALLVVPLAASEIMIKGNSGFDPATQSLEGAECYGYLSAQGYKTFGDVPAYPDTAGTTLVSNASSPYCGTCWGITYENITVNVMVIDTVLTWDEATEDIFVVSMTALNELTNGTIAPGNLFEGSAVQLDQADCGPVYHTECAYC